MILRYATVVQRCEVGSERAKLFINHGNHDDSFVEVCMVFGYDLLCDLLEMLNLINIGSTVATRRNLVEPIQRTNMRGLMAERLRAYETCPANGRRTPCDCIGSRGEPKMSNEV
jgi:hypothetical protein